MRVKVSDRKHLHDLISLLRECGCVAERGSADVADVYAPAARTEQAGQTEVGVYLAAWGIKNAGRAEIVQRALR